MNNITLIGMPGVGKSTIGVVLAKVLGYQFLDSDLLIQKQERRRLREIIEEEGYMGFKEIENRVNASIDVNHTVIATGGSVVYCEEAMNLQCRGVLLKDGQTLKDLYEERTPLYEKYADVVLDEEGKDLEESLHDLLEILEENSK